MSFTIVVYLTDNAHRTSASKLFSPHRCFVSSAPHTRLHLRSFVWLYGTVLRLINLEQKKHYPESILFPLKTISLSHTLNLFFCSLLKTKPNTHYKKKTAECTRFYRKNCNKNVFSRPFCYVPKLQQMKCFLSPRKHRSIMVYASCFMFFFLYLHIFSFHMFTLFSTMYPAGRRSKMRKTKTKRGGEKKKLKNYTKKMQKT